VRNDCVEETRAVDHTEETSSQPRRSSAKTKPGSRARQKNRGKRKRRPRQAKDSTQKWKQGKGGNSLGARNVNRRRPMLETQPQGRMKGPGLQRNSQAQKWERRLGRRPQPKETGIKTGCMKVNLARTLYDQKHGHMQKARGIP